MKIRALWKLFIVAAMTSVLMACAHGTSQMACEQGNPSAFKKINVKVHGDGSAQHPWIVVTRPPVERVEAKKDGIEWRLTGDGTLTIDFQNPDIEAPKCEKEGNMWVCRSLTFCSSGPCSAVEKYDVIVDMNGTEVREDPILIIDP